ERAHLVRGLGADAEPVLRLLHVDLVLRHARLRIVVAQLIDEAPIAGAARIGDHDAEGRILLGAHALESNHDCHEVPFSPRDRSKGPPGPGGRIGGILTHPGKKITDTGPARFPRSRPSPDTAYRSLGMPPRKPLRAMPPPRPICLIIFCMPSKSRMSLFTACTLVPL